MKLIAGCDIMNFELNLIFQIKPFFLHDQKVDKISNILRTKKAFKMKQKAFFIISEGLLIKQVTIFLKGNSPI